MKEGNNRKEVIEKEEIEDKIVKRGRSMGKSTFKVKVTTAWGFFLKIFS
jgi:hypothetical protein